MTCVESTRYVKDIRKQKNKKTCPREFYSLGEEKQNIKVNMMISNYIVG